MLDKDFHFGTTAGVLVGLLAVGIALLCMMGGFSLSERRIKRDCENFGAVLLDGTKYTCNALGKRGES